MDNDFEYLAKRAKIFIEYLDKNKILKIFPEREATKKDLQERITSGSVKRLKILNNIIDDLIVGKNAMSVQTKHDIISFFNQKLGEDKSFIIDNKLRLYHDIKAKGFIKSRNVINDAIIILNSDILGLTQTEKDELKNIIAKSMMSRIP
jgi:hypothetical protein